MSSRIAVSNNRPGGPPDRNHAQKGGKKCREAGNARIIESFPGNVYALACDSPTRAAAWFKKRLSQEQVRILGKKVRVSLPGDKPGKTNDLLQAAEKEELIIKSAVAGPRGWKTFSWL
ncbi:MAG: hypothetical protein R6U29_11390 [Desulfosudaceae bacterium]